MKFFNWVSKSQENPIPFGPFYDWTNVINYLISKLQRCNNMSRNMLESEHADFIHHNNFMFNLLPEKSIIIFCDPHLPLPNDITNFSEPC